jgi:hypothetical protein
LLQPVLMALATETPADYDEDGLSDLQESILHTNAVSPDTDGDGYDDLVELARGSDPTNAVGIPGPQTVHVGMAASEENGFVKVVSAVYASHAQFPAFGFKLGVSFGGVEALLPTNTLLSASQLRLFPAIDATGWIIVLETPVPKAFIVEHGYLGTFALVSEKDSSAPHAAAVLNLFAIDGEVASFGPAPASMGTSGGSIYQPLGRGEDLPKATWEGGLVCYQYTEIIGTDGSSVILDVEDASCQPLDSSCNAVRCQGGIGTQIKVLDAGALAGGG